ncbi:MAG: ankyrin repeat domain-containing protein [Gammaproteobacteria bacterium]|jgi:ankyrin repeat protein|nr:ankyrin repeat domain-containing protein [Gammaproteobacteria bacterium]
MLECNTEATNQQMLEEDFRTAAYQGDEEQVSSLLAKSGFNINARDQFGHTALHNACMRGHHRVVNILLNIAGINLDAVDEMNNNALHHAALNGYPKVAALLLANDLFKNQINNKNKSGKTALFCACTKELRLFHLLVKLLLANNADATIPANDGSMPLHVASFLGNIETVRLLLSIPLLPLNAPRNDGRRPVELALINSKFSVVALLESYGSTIFNNKVKKSPLSERRNDNNEHHDDKDKDDRSEQRMQFLRKLR